MKFYLKFFIIIITLLFSFHAFSNDSITYINMNKILNESKAGISIKNKLEK